MALRPAERANFFISHGKRFICPDSVSCCARRLSVRRAESPEKAPTLNLDDQSIHMAAESVFAGDKRVLICYYSRTGLTKRVLDILQPQLHADLFEIKVDSNYDGFTGQLRAGWHFLRSSLPSLTSQPQDFATYDVYIVAGPVWGCLPAGPVGAFLEASDFGGKPVVALATYGNILRDYMAAFQAKVKNGRAIATEAFSHVERETDESLAAKVRTWLEGL
jgi:flavodoxin